MSRAGNYFLNFYFGQHADFTAVGFLEVVRLAAFDPAACNDFNFKPPGKLLT